MGIFGWDLPPGVTSAMIEEQAYVPPECEDCELYDEELGTCPYMDNVDYCYKRATVKKCANCGKKMCKVKGLFEDSEIVCDVCLMYCCSDKCAAELQDKVYRGV